MAEYNHLNLWDSNSTSQSPNKWPSQSPNKWPSQSPNKWPHEQYGAYPKTPKQTPVNIFSLFPNIDRWAIGYDTMFEMLEKMSVSKSAGFPPYNIIKNDDKYEITMALAGYKKDQLSVKTEDHKLVVETVDIDDDVEDEGEILHKGIAQRNFTSTFALGEYVRVKSAKFEDGLLTISLEIELPEEKKPKEIEIK